MIPASRPTRFLAALAVVGLTATGAPARAGTALLVQDPRSPLLYRLQMSRNGQLVLWNGGAPGTGLHLFGYDRRLRRVDQIDVTPGGTPGNGLHTFLGGVSADGRYVIFSSDASNLVPNDANGLKDVFLRDRVRRTTTMISVDGRGKGLPYPSDGATISDDGSTLAYQTCGSSGDCALQVRRRTSRWPTTIVRGHLAHESPALSGNGKWIAFSSYATLTSDDHRPDSCGSDIYLREVATSRLTLLTGDTAASSTDDACGTAGNGFPDLNSFTTPVVDAAGRCVAYRQTTAIGQPNTIWFRDVASTSSRLVTTNVPAPVQTGITLTADCARVYFLSALDLPALGTVDAGNGGRARVYEWTASSGATARVSPDVPAPGGDLCADCPDGDPTHGAMPTIYSFAISADARVLATVTSAGYDASDHDHDFDLYLHLT